MQFIKKDKLTNAAPILALLTERLASEREYLNTVNPIFLTPKPGAIPSPQEIHDLYKLELAFKLNISAYYSLMGALLNIIKESFTLKDKSKLLDVDSLYREISEDIKALNEALAQYENIKATKQQPKAQENKNSVKTETGDKKFRKSIKRASTFSLKCEEITSEEAEEAEEAEAKAVDPDETMISEETITDNPENSDPGNTSDTIKITEPKARESIVERPHRQEFDSALNTLVEKLQDLSKIAKTNKNYTKAAAEASALHRALHEAREAYFINKNTTTDTFKSTCMDAIKTARQELAHHRGWSEFLLNLTHVVLSIATLGLANIASVLATGRYRFIPTVKTDSEQKLDEFATVLNTL
ncbi:hypothetical protein clem_07350 [Legionella clemsonensis]|uniref:Uncharacterized protein n=1 Tax=Legionella clemsonensis TaxID=1867846 RepID=A0A222P2G2_9GAMM|nr:hypothetical protein clem_07350 [Legionella clemsonensis]